MTEDRDALAPRVLPFGDDAIGQAAAAIACGRCVAAPTETVYGLFADATDAMAVAAVFSAKGRPTFNPLIVHVADVAAADRLAILDDGSRELAERFWPGPLTIVLPLRPEAGIAALATAGLGTVALRAPSHRAIGALLARTGKPLVGPSANRSGSISPTRAAHVAASLGGRVPIVVDDGPTGLGLESTIVHGGRVLRPGPVTQADLFPGRRPEGRFAAGDGRIVAPGQLASHYAPRKPLRTNARDRREGEWLIGFGPVSGDDSLSASGDLVEAAAKLFDALHLADASLPSRIAVAPIPGHGIGEAINDRLSRAAHR